MAGGFGVKTDPKWKHLNKNSFSSEVLKDSPQVKSSPKTETKFSFGLNGILGLNQTVELNKQKDNLKQENKSLFNSINYLEKDFKVLLDTKQQELAKSIDELRFEIQKLVKNTANLEKEVEIAAITPVVEANEYQVSFLNRLRIFIVNFNQSISEAGIWLDSMSKRKKKKNYFWSTVKNKKAGGEQYLFSNEHSVARSAG